MGSQYFVRFVKFNINILSSIINKTVKFSTVYEFNDFNELGFISGFMGVSENGPEFLQNQDKKIISKLNEYLQNPVKRIQLYQNAYNSGLYSREYLDDYKRDLCNASNFDINNFVKLIPFFYENIAFSEVGILCLSDLKIFYDDSAQLMFAHYADNLKGVALIYKHSNPKASPSRVKYYPKDFEESEIRKKNGIFLKRCSSHRQDIILSWMDGDYTKDIHTFLVKSDKWSYEKEYRLFDRPGIKPASEVGLELVGIFYTPRFSQDSIKVLNNLNDCHYNGGVFIEEIKPSHSAYIFNKGKGTLKTWLEQQDLV